MKLPQVQAALKSRRQENTLRVCEPVTLENEIEDREAVVLSTSSEEHTLRLQADGTTAVCEPLKEAVGWPEGAIEIIGQQNQRRIIFADAGDLGDCVCVGECYAFSCLNSLSDIYCTDGNCALGGRCGNSTRSLDSLRLFETEHSGLGVFTTLPVELGVNVAEYCGVLEAYEGRDEANQATVPLKHNSRYSLLLQKRASRRKDKFVYIEPIKFGSITRFVNHSCSPNCQFREVLFRDQVRVVTMTLRPIKANEEITVSYSLRPTVVYVRMQCMQR
ncbi:hypothetical protein V7S43_008076 [Phytophthora oleae]|uniref:SET domain-containing protein n=1 Tax=Phytophthora oleae TaxID=2107226 RepID=A0ABD3FL51_9STRA